MYGAAIEGQRAADLAGFRYASGHGTPRKKHYQRLECTGGGLPLVGFINALTASAGLTPTRRSLQAHAVCLVVWTSGVLASTE